MMCWWRTVTFTICTARLQNNKLEESINTVDVSEIAEVKLAEKNGEQYIFGITNHIDDIWWQGFKLEYEYDGRDLFELYHLYREDYIINNR